MVDRSCILAHYSWSRSEKPFLMCQQYIFADQQLTTCDVLQRIVGRDCTGEILEGHLLYVTAVGDGKKQ